MNKIDEQAINDILGSMGMQEASPDKREQLQESRVSNE
jgi:hypothetical protein